MRYFRANQAASLLSLAVFLWTLTLAPALASLRPLQPVAKPEVSLSVANAATPPAEITAADKSKEDHSTCACLQCHGKKTCCCKPPVTDSASASGRAPLCEFRSLCDRATEAVNLPFTWWVAVVPSPALTTLPPALALPPFSFHAGTSLETAFSSAPEAPPRLLS